MKDEPQVNEIDLWSFTFSVCNDDGIIESDASSTNSIVGLLPLLGIAGLAVVLVAILIAVTVVVRKQHCKPKPALVEVELTETQGSGTALLEGQRDKEETGVFTITDEEEVHGPAMEEDTKELLNEVTSLQQALLLTSEKEDSESKV